MVWVNSLFQNTHPKLYKKLFQSFKLAFKLALKNLSGISPIFSVACKITGKFALRNNAKKQRLKFSYGLHYAITKTSKVAYKGISIKTLKGIFSFDMIILFY